ncbi:hypothetical protein HBI24_007050 [Parastagonospora nodorum]|nr:hypothetical protein HBH43_006840 [Parastagonospora nodorum]KAH5096849.1 hypothetical protein HBH72_131970 [Parastagonospora nodorum]KAH5594777.1 hypothetical protein HBI24_007050 [Parastagonospora nodorum]
MWALSQTGASGVESGRRRVESNATQRLNDPQQDRRMYKCPTPKNIMSNMASDNAVMTHETPAAARSPLRSQYLHLHGTLSHQPSSCRFD